MKESKKRKLSDKANNVSTDTRSQPINDAIQASSDKSSINEGIKHKKVKKQNNKQESLESHEPNNRLNENPVDVSNLDAADLLKQKSRKKKSQNQFTNNPKQKQFNVADKKAKICEPPEAASTIGPRDDVCTKVLMKNKRQSLQTGSKFETDTETLTENLFLTHKSDFVKTSNSKHKKVKKNKKGKKDSQAKESVSDDSGEKKSARMMASEYLVQWDQNREHWSFQKVRQVWLLQHLYQQDQVSDDEFKILLCYLENLRGKGRELTLQRAEMIVNADIDVDAGSPDQDSVQYERARQILQMLT